MPVWHRWQCFQLAVFVPHQQAAVFKAQRSFIYHDAVHIWSSPRVSAQTTAFYSACVASQRQHHVSRHLISSVCWQHAAACRYERYWHWTSSRNACSTTVQLWFLHSNLQLNADKSEVVILGTAPQLRSSANIREVEVAGSRLREEVTRHNNWFAPAIRLSRQGGSEGVQLRTRITDDGAQTVVCSIVASR